MTPRTPLEPASAAEALAEAADREQVFEVLLRAARATLRFAALLSVHADQIRGRTALADMGFDSGGVEALRIARDTVPAFEAVIAAGEPAIGKIATGEPFIDGVLEQLGGARRTMFVMPIAIHARTAMLLVGHRGSDPIAPADVADLVAIGSAAAAALARLLRAKTQVDAKPVRAQSEGYEVELSYDSPAAKRAALAELRRAQEWHQLAHALEGFVGDGREHGEPDEDEQLDLLVELGRVEAERLGRPDAAIAAWRAAQTIDGGDSRVLELLEALYVQQGRWHDCVALLEQRLALTEGRRQRIAMLLNLGTIAHERLADDDRALEAYERVRALEPHNAAASRELEALYAGRRQWEQLASLLLDRASHDGDPAALESAAQMYEDKVGDPHAAFVVWLALVRREPERPFVIDQLDRLAGAANDWDESIAESSALASELEGAHPEPAARIWHLVGRWQRDRRRDIAAAIDALDRATRLAPNELEPMFELLELLREGARWGELAELLGQRAAIEGDRARQSELYAELGDIYESQLDRADEAIAVYERALAAEPESPHVLVALHRLYLAAESWTVLGELVPRLIAALAPTAPDSVLVDLYVELGLILADQLGSSEEAAAAFREALALDPQHRAAFAGLEHVYQVTGQTVALLGAAEARAAHIGDVTLRAQRTSEVAAAWHDAGRFDRAAECWRTVIELEPVLAAYHGLVDALRAGADWAGLVVALQAQRTVAGADATAIALELAEIFETKLDDADEAIACCREVLAGDPQHRLALDALARLCDRAGRPQLALEALQRLLALTSEPRARADLLARIGHVYLGTRDAVNARLHFVQALALDLESARVREGMARVHIQQGELVAAGEELVRAAQLSSTQDETLRLFVDAAWLYRHRLDDTARARECLLYILELDPEHGDAKQAYAELLADTRQWEALWPHLEAEVARVRGDDRLDVLVRAARCAVELDRFAIALELYDEASAIDATPATQLERADALYRSKNVDAAAAAYQTIIARHQATLDRTQLMMVYRRLSAIHTELGKLPQAQTFHNKVLDLEPTNAGALADLTELHLARGHVEEAIATLRTLAGTARGGDRVPFLERIGDLYRDKLANRPRAMSTYLEALELDGANRRILQRVLDLQSEAGQWRPAVDTIAKFLEHETEPARRAAYFLASAEIRRTELKDKPGALDHYDSALDELAREEPLNRARLLDAFRSVEELVAGDDNWKGLEQAYRRMIKRMPAGDPSLVLLWHALGEVYRLRLAHPQSAIEAFEVAHALDPDKSPHRTRLLAELYAATGAKPETSAKLVTVDPTNPDAYRALGRTSLEAGRLDEAWCVARALVLLKQATPQEAALYKQYKPDEVRKATGILDEDSWSLVRHPDEDRAISSIFAMIWEGPVALHAGPAKSFDLKPKERMPIEHDTRVVAKIFRHASRLVNVAMPDVYVQPRRAGRLLLANCVDKGKLAPAVIVGRDLMTGYRDTEIASTVGSMLVLMRPAYYLKLVLSSVDELEAALAAAALIVGKKLGRAELEPLVAQFVPELQKVLSRPSVELLRGLVHALPERPDLGRWRTAVDVAAQRAGLLVAGELAAAARMVASETVPGQRPAQRVQDLVAYSVSPSYFAVRQHLGVAVG
ncbi:MAG: tetratricopeptide repeat protein [Kofleriaceae bacterium]